MNISDIVKTLEGTLVAGGESDRTVGTVVANDLMSDVLLNDGEDILLLTFPPLKRHGIFPIPKNVTDWSRPILPRIKSTGRNACAGTAVFIRGFGTGTPLCSYAT